MTASASPCVVRNSWYAELLCTQVSKLRQAQIKWRRPLASFSGFDGDAAMALIECGECGRSVSTEAVTCPGCGAKVVVSETGLERIAAVGGTLFRLAVVLVLALGAGAYCAMREPEPRVRVAMPVEQPELRPPLARPLPEPARRPAPPPTWSYGIYSDEMTGRAVHYASIQSSNLIELGFPYGGPQRGTLTIRKHPRYGDAVIFSIERGQLLCSNYDGCSLLVRFDAQAPQRLTAMGPESHSTETLFIEGFGRFVAAAKKAERVKIEAKFFSQDPQTFDFHVAGLRWPRPGAK